MQNLSHFHSLQPFFEENTGAGDGGGAADGTGNGAAEMTVEQLQAKVKELEGHLSNRENQTKRLSQEKEELKIKAKALDDIQKAWDAFNGAPSIEMAEQLLGPKFKELTKGLTKAEKKETDVEEIPDEFQPIIKQLKAESQKQSAALQAKIDALEKKTEEQRAVQNSADYRRDFTAVMMKEFPESQHSAKELAAIAKNLHYNIAFKRMSWDDGVAAVKEEIEVFGGKKVAQAKEDEKKKIEEAKKVAGKNKTSQPSGAPGDMETVDIRKMSEKQRKEYLQKLKQQAATRLKGVYQGSTA